MVGESDDLLAPVGEQRIGNDQQAIGALLPQRAECSVNLLVAGGVERAQRQPKRAGGAAVLVFK